MPDDLTPDQVEMKVLEFWVMRDRQCAELKKMFAGQCHTLYGYTSFLLFCREHLQMQDFEVEMYGVTDTGICPTF